MIGLLKTKPSGKSSTDGAPDGSINGCIVWAVTENKYFTLVYIAYFESKLLDISQVLDSL